MVTINPLLVRFEAYKLIHKISILCIFLFIGLLVYKFYISTDILYQQNVVYIDDQDDIQFVNGKKALVVEKRIQARHKGYITIEKGEAAFLDYKEKAETFGKEGELVWGSEYRPIRTMLIQAFSPPGKIDYFIFDSLKLKDIKDIYKNRVSLIEEGMYLPENSIHASPLIGVLAQKIQTPFYFGGSGIGWRKLTTGKRYLTYLVLVIIVCASFTFFNETLFSSAIHFSLATLHGRANHAVAKIIALLTFVTVTYCVVMSIYMGLILSLFGTDGGDSVVQIQYFYSLYNATIKQAALLYCITVYFIMVFFALFTFLISLYINNIVSTILIASAFCYAGQYIPKGSILERFLPLFPGSALDIDRIITRPIVYNLFGKPVLFVYLYIPACIALSIVISLLIIRKFKTMKV